MAGGHVNYRHLSRDSSARKALLRGLVTQLVRHEHIQTTYAKAKEAQRLAEKLITLAKRGGEGCRRSAQGILYTPHLLLPKLLGELRERYATREGGYTRVLRTEPKHAYGQNESAILELVDGPRDSRFMMTAKVLARDRLRGLHPTSLTELNRKKVTSFRGEEDLKRMVRRFMSLEMKRTGKGAPPVEEGGAEAAEMAAREGSKAKTMGPAIVPDYVKQEVGRTAVEGSWLSFGD